MITPPRAPRKLGGAIRSATFALAVATVSVLGLGPSDDPAEAYLLYDNGALDYIVGSDEGLRWSEEAWGPRETLLWELEDGADWSLLFDAADDVAPIIEEALAMWSGIETADISWQLAGVADPVEDTSRFGDSRNHVFLERRRSGDHVWYYIGAHIWWVRNPARSAWEVTECDVGLPWHLWLDDDLLGPRRRSGLDSDDVRSMLRMAAREFGHCLGLGPAVQFPGTRRLRTTPSDDDGFWRRGGAWEERAPFMGNYWEPLSLDDRVAASLLRPRAGWRGTVGSLSGVLESDGASVPYAHVYAIRQTGSGMREPVGAFSNREGEFVIEGLPRGDYILWALPIRYYWNHSRLIQAGAATDVKDALALHPVRVDPGRVTDGITITMRRGRE